MALGQARAGEVLQHGVSGFPSFFNRKNTATAIPTDVWEYLSYVSRENLGKRQVAVAEAYVDQAFEFYAAASNPRLSSRPLLYYYSFLNLAKLFLLIKGVQFPPDAWHGISDPRSNLTQRVHFKSQRVDIKQLRSDHRNLAPEFVTALGGSRALNGAQYKVLNLLAEVPGIHRTYRSVTGRPPRFCPLETVEIVKRDSNYWVRLSLERDHPDVIATLPAMARQREFRSVFMRVQSPEPEHIWFETAVTQGPRRAVDTALRALRDKMLGCGVWSIADHLRHRFYLSTFPAGKTLPQLASVYAIMFYFGSVTRYQPYNFDKIVAGGYAWLVSEFIESQPPQFVYNLAALASDANVVAPLSAPPT